MKTKILKLLGVAAMCFINADDALAAPPRTAKLELYTATYRIDSHYAGDAEKHYYEGWAWRDAEGKPIQFWPKYFQEGGLLELYFVNTGKGIAKDMELYIDGQNASDLMKVKPRDILWYRLKPASIQPAQVLQIMARFKVHPGKPVKLQIKSEGKILFTKSVDVKKCTSEGLIARVNLDKNMQDLRLWIQSDDHKNIKNIMFDGMDFSDCMTVAKSYGGYVPVKLSLPAPLKNGTEHTVFVQNGDARSAVRFRAFPNEFNFAIYEGPKADNMKMHHFNLSWHHRSPGEKEVITRWKDGIKVIAPYHGVFPQFRNTVNIFANYMPDEPDGRDFIHNKHINPAWKRLGLDSHVINLLTEKQRETEQSTLNINVVDGCFKPAEYFTYGRMADILAMDQYAVSAGRKVTEVYDTGKVVRYATEPYTFWTLLGCYRYVDRFWQRFPNPQEMRYMALGAVAIGTQTLGYWMYLNGTVHQGPATAPEVWYSMGQVNSEIKLIAHLLQKSYPVDKLTLKAPDGVAAEVLRTLDDEATVLVLLNKNCVSDKNGFNVPQIKDFTFELPLPPGTKAEHVFKLSADGPKDIRDFKLNGRKVKIPVKNFNAGDIYVIAHDPSAYSRIVKLYQEEIRPANRKAFEFMKVRKAELKAAAEARAAKEKAKAAKAKKK